MDTPLFAVDERDGDLTPRMSFVGGGTSHGNSFMTPSVMQ